MAIEPGDDRRLDALLRDHAAYCPVSEDLRQRILASAPGYARRLDALLRQTRRLTVSAALGERILAAAPAGGVRDLLASLWPFGPLWPPAVGLLALAALGIFLGSTDAATLQEPVSVNGALSEEVLALTLVGNDRGGVEILQWPE